jgi:DNA-binding ferritin-like protein (Dps family)
MKHTRNLWRQGTEMWRQARELDEIGKMLDEAALGRREVTMMQLKAAEIILRKTIPDLKQIEHTGSIDHRTVRELPDADLYTLIDKLRGEAGVADGGDGGGLSQASAAKPAGVH